MTTKKSTQHTNKPMSFYYTQRDWQRTVGYGTVPEERKLENMKISEISNANSMTLPEFWDLLDKHDWLYQMADDQRSYQKGKQEREELKRYASLSPEHEELFMAFAKWGQRLMPGQNPDAQKPVRPE